MMSSPLLPPPNRRLQRCLQAEMTRLPAPAFARCLGDLLSAMGYQGVRTFAPVRRGRRSVGGRDLEAVLITGLTTARVIAQLKQYERPVSRRFVDELRGAMLRLSARQGVLITTGTFSRAARIAAAPDYLAPVRLVDGAELLALLARYGIGVRRRKGRARLDRAYFAALRARYGDELTRDRSIKPAASRPYPPASLPGPLLDISAPFSSVTHHGMRWHTHVLLGISSLWLLEALPGPLPPEQVAVLAGLAAFGALLPDLDAAESKLRSLSLAGVRPFVPVSQAVHARFGHRGALHSPLMLLPLGLLLLPAVFWTGVLAPAALWLGYASHLLSDAATKSGLPRWGRAGRLYLLPTRWRIRTGSSAEDALLPLLAFAVVVLLLQHLPLTGSL